MYKIFSLITVLITLNGLLVSNVTAKDKGEVLNPFGDPRAQTGEVIREKGGEVGNPVLEIASEVKCDVKNKYMLKSGNNIVASYTVTDDVSWPESSGSTDGFNSSHKVDVSQLFKNVQEPIDGLSIEETKEVLTAASKSPLITSDLNVPTEIKLTPPTNGLLGFGKTGDWKTAKVSSRLSIGESRFALQESSSEGKIDANLTMIPSSWYTDGVRKEILRKSTGIMDLIVANEVSFDCKNRKEETAATIKEVNNTSRANSKSSVPVENKSNRESQTGATSQK